MNRLISNPLLGCALAFAGVALTPAAHAQEDGLRAAIAGKHRSPANVARDPARHPLETLRFFGIEPTMTVVEISPGGGWYTEILAPFLQPKGKLIAAGFDPKSEVSYERTGAERLAKKFAAAPEVYGKVETAVFKPVPQMTYAPAGSVDMVLTFRNIHNWMATLDEAGLKEVFAGIHATLKPGGVLGVVEHRLPENRVQDPKAGTGYVQTSYVIRVAESAGFKLAVQAEINGNPKDSADHAKGVWSLPPNYANGDVDRSKYAAIGESDRMTLKFVKPK